MQVHKVIPIDWWMMHNVYALHKHMHIDSEFRLLMQSLFVDHQANTWMQFYLK